MNFHSNKELFNQAIIMASEAMMINPAIIEKDYYVTYLLKEIVAQIPSIIFIGGTSLSKCHNLIKRFSEDIDLAYEYENSKMTEAKRRSFSHLIIQVISDSGLEMLNINEIKSRRDFNQYLIGYDSIYSITSLKSHLIVETEVSIHSFPTEFLKADCYLYQYLKKQNLNELINEYHLEPFFIKTQSLERTFIDKIFAVCDYYLTSNLKGHSRHLYDLYKIYPRINIDNNFLKLIEDVREIRSKNKMCLSAQPEYMVTNILQTIITEDIYKKDYNEVTRDLLFEDVSYQQTKETLNRIENLNIF